MELLSKLQDAFAVPHTFKPRLGFLDALVATLASLCRIFLGSLLFAAWGVFTLRVWNAIPNRALGALAVLLPALLFVGSLAALLRSISFVQDRITAKL
jgi:hypothetical protein